MPLVRVAHLDLDAFYAAVEEQDKPSLRGRPVVVGGTGPRGVVATANYPARAYGVRSAMSTAEARRRCPAAAVLHPRFPAYAERSRRVLALLEGLSPVLEPLSLDEAYADLEAGGVAGDAAAVTAVLARLRAGVRSRTGLTASVGAGSTKLVAKIASDLCKPDGLLVVDPADEPAFLAPLPVTRLWGVGPAAEQALHRLGISTVADLAAADPADVVSLLGQAHGRALHAMAQGIDPRPVSTERGSRSIGAETTFAADLVDRSRLRAELDGQAVSAVGRLVRAGLAARTVTVKVRLHDFRTLTRSTTLPGATDDLGTVRREARRLLDAVDTTDGVRLLGVTLSGLAEHVQASLDELLPPPPPPPPGATREAGGAAAGGAEAGAAEAGGAAAGAAEGGGAEAAGDRAVAPVWLPGQDVEHAVHGRGWVWGSGAGRVTVRFESRDTPPGPVRTYPVGDPDLRPAEPEPLPDP